ncbi:MAG: hypothetical protein K6G88_11185 [Lachnospiraceae bacterium]|nr:hypothetical protein [Lachnospiraceae bacterium]
MIDFKLYPILFTKRTLGCSSFDCDGYSCSNVASAARLKVINTVLQRLLKNNYYNSRTRKSIFKDIVLKNGVLKINHVTASSLNKKSPEDAIELYNFDVINNFFFNTYNRKSYWKNTIDDGEDIVVASYELYMSLNALCECGKYQFLLSGIDLLMMDGDIYQHVLDDDWDSFCNEIVEYSIDNSKQNISTDECLEFLQSDIQLYDTFCDLHKEMSSSNIISFAYEGIIPYMIANYQSFNDTLYIYETYECEIINDYKEFKLSLLDNLNDELIDRADYLISLHPSKFAFFHELLNYDYGECDIANYEYMPLMLGLYMVEVDEVMRRLNDKYSFSRQQPELVDGSCFYERKRRNYKND